MKSLRFWVTAGVVALGAAVGTVALLHGQDNQGQGGFSGASYLTTVKDSQVTSHLAE